MNQQIPKIISLVNKTVIFLAGIGAIIISVGSLFGFLDIPLAKYPELTILLIGLFLTGISVLLIDGVNHIELLLQSKSISETIRLENVDDMYDYINRHLKSASISIDDITWGSRKGNRTKSEDEGYQKYLKTIEKVCKKKNIRYREISSLSDEHFFKRSINLMKYYNYHLGYYDISQNQIPLITFIVIDSKKVITANYRAPFLPPEGEVNLLISDPDVVKLYGDYFEALWFNSKKIKDNIQTDNKLIEQIKKKLNI